MAQTPDRFPGLRQDEGVKLDSAGVAPSANGEIRYVTGTGFRFFQEGSSIGFEPIITTLGVTRGGTGTSTQFTQGSVVFAGAAGVYTEDNAGFNWDNAAKTLLVYNAAAVATIQAKTNNTASYSAIKVFAGPLGLGLSQYGSTWAGTGAYSASCAAFNAIAPQFNIVNEQALGTIGFYTDGYAAVNQVGRLSSTGLAIGSLGGLSPKGALHLLGGTVQTIIGAAGSTNVLGNAYYSGGWKHLAPVMIPTAMFFNPNGAGFGDIGFYNAAAGLADSAVTWVPMLTLYRDGNVGIGNITAPTARLHLPAGTITAGTGPLKFTSGPLTTVAVAGQVEFLTDGFYGTQTTGARRIKFAQDNISPISRSFMLMGG
jgi:hypothetical protein